MPHTLPAATTTRHSTVARDDEKRISLPKGTKVEPMGIAADQDGFNNKHVVCKVGGEWMMIEKDALTL